MYIWALSIYKQQKAAQQQKKRKQIRNSTKNYTIGIILDLRI